MRASLVFGAALIALPLASADAYFRGGGYGAAGGHWGGAAGDGHWGAAGEGAYGGHWGASGTPGHWNASGTGAAGQAALTIALGPRQLE